MQDFFGVYRRCRRSATKTFFVAALIPVLEVSLLSKPVCGSTLNSNHSLYFGGWSPKISVNIMYSL